MMDLAGGHVYAHVAVLNKHIIEEAVASGIEEILIITGRNKRAIEDHFDRSIELEIELEKKHNTGCSK